MNSNRKYLWILTLLLSLSGLSAGLAAAQYQGGGYGRPQGGDGQRRPMSVDERVKRMTKDLNLTTDQQTKVKSILEDEQKKAQDLRNDTSSDRQTMRQKMMQLRQDTSDQVRALLDDKQKEKFDKMEQQREDRMQNRRGGGASAPGAANPGGNAPAQN
jgi:Spy/CpxP family protein refolding chaperone